MPLTLGQGPVHQGAHTNVSVEVRAPASTAQHHTEKTATRLQGAAADNVGWYEFRLIISRFLIFQEK